MSSRVCNPVMTSVELYVKRGMMQPCHDQCQAVCYDAARPCVKQYAMMQPGHDQVS
jgi:hypothetical protein